MSERDLDFQLVKRIQNGEQQAFTLLVRKYQNRVANILTRPRKLIVMMVVMR